MLSHPIELLDIRPQKLKQFVDKGLTTVEDLAYCFPRRYIDFRHITSTADAVIGEYQTLQGKVIAKKSGSGSMFVAICEEERSYYGGYNPQFSVVWFGTNYHIAQLVIGRSYTFCGKVSEYRGNIQINSPLAFSENPAMVCRIFPIYPKISGMSSSFMMESINKAIGYLRANARMDEKNMFATSIQLLPLFDAIDEIHQPTSRRRFQLAQQRIAFEKIYDFYADLKAKDRYLIGTAIGAAEKDQMTRSVIRDLPFALTPDQAKAIDEIIVQAQHGRRLHTLVSGDVGCGKTMIAILAAIQMWENSFQTIVMAPTLILAQQHYQEFLSFASRLGIRVGLLTTETKKRERDQLLRSMETGTLDILIGTQSVLSEDIVPARLGLTIIDEEHKFGVKQKARLEEYDKAGVHHISMTATPIPRSIAMAVYGNDLAVLPIRSMPKGRKPIITQHSTSFETVLEKMYEEVQSGRQGYIICPFIEDSDSPQFQDIVSVSTAVSMANQYFAQKPNPVRIGVISGDMKKKDILAVEQSFAQHGYDILVSTTIVEVGVNVPNASIIAIMSADRFGLAALHQLRGRVGRGSDQGYCMLCAPRRTERLDIMCRTTDGFQIAEYDLKMRGPGDLTGDAQSGGSVMLETIMQRPRLTQLVKKHIFEKK